MYHTRTLLVTLGLALGLMALQVGTAEASPRFRGGVTFSFSIGGGYGYVGHTYGYYGRPYRHHVPYVRRYYPRGYYRRYTPRRRWSSGRSFHYRPRTHYFRRPTRHYRRSTRQRRW